MEVSGTTVAVIVLKFKCMLVNITFSLFNIEAYYIK